MVESRPDGTIYYLNDASTVKVKPEVIDTISENIYKHWFNPSDINVDAVDVKLELEHTRDAIAEFIGADPEEIIFTASGTEANNLAIQGFINAYEECGDFVTTPCEHPSIRNIADYYEDNNILRIYWSGYDNKCTYDYDNLDELLKQIRESTKQYPAEILVSIQMVNNETGVKNDIKRIAEICKKYQGVYLHTDATQGMIDGDIDVKNLDVDMLTFSGHKLGVPAGVGVLYVRSGVKIEPLIFGGGQERGYWSGTENAAYINTLMKGITFSLISHTVSMEKARNYYSFYDLMKSKLLSDKRIKKYCPELSINCNDTAEMCGHIISVCFKGYDNKELLAVLDSNGVICSAGSACSNHENKPSRTLLNFGYSEEEANSTLRFSSIISPAIMESYIDDIIDRIAFSLKMLRKE